MRLSPMEQEKLTIFTAAEVSGAVEDDEMYSFAPAIDVRSMLHERKRTRLYIS